jgi:hypothetical protein
MENDNVKNAISKTIDHRKVVNTNGCVHIPKGKKWKQKERAWFEPLIARYEHWRDLVDMKPSINIEVERGICFMGRNMKMTGMPRADAIIWHSDNECSIVEAKVEPDINHICGGIGQLMFYKTAVETYWGVKVDALLLTSPTLPPLMLETIANCSAPIRFLKRDEDDSLSGLVPRYSL